VAVLVGLGLPWGRVSFVARPFWSGEVLIQ
jgi:hypothetical protein